MTATSSFSTTAMCATSGWQTASDPPSASAGSALACDYAVVARLGGTSFSWARSGHAGLRFGPLGTGDDSSGANVVSYRARLACHLTLYFQAARPKTGAFTRAERHDP